MEPKEEQIIITITHKTPDMTHESHVVMHALAADLMLIAAELPPGTFLLLPHTPPESKRFETT